MSRSRVTTCSSPCADAPALITLFALSTTNGIAMQNQLENQFGTGLTPPSAASPLPVGDRDDTNASIASTVLTAADVDAIARELDAVPQRKEFDVKAQLARLRPTLLRLKKKGYDAAAIVDLLKVRNIQTSVSSVTRAMAAPSQAAKRQPEA